MTWLCCDGRPAMACTHIRHAYTYTHKGYSISCNCVLREGLGTNNVIYGFWIKYKYDAFKNFNCPLLNVTYTWSNTNYTITTFQILGIILAIISNSNMSYIRWDKQNSWGFRQVYSLHLNTMDRDLAANCPVIHTILTEQTVQVRLWHGF